MSPSSPLILVDVAVLFAWVRCLVNTMKKDSENNMYFKISKISLHQLVHVISILQIKLRFKIRQLSARCDQFFSFSDNLHLL